MTSPTESSIAELQQALDDGSLTGAEIIDASLQAADDHSALKAFIAPPRRPDAELAEGPLSDIPIAVKDNICTRDYPTTAASRLLEDFTPPEDATVVRRLRKAGAAIFGKTNLDEFGMGASTEHSHFGSTLHPDDPNRVPGGSSGGSAVCVATGMTPAALGSDTGGSVRQPASFCGVVGFRPTWSRVSRRGLIAFASSLDQIGWLTRNVDDAALLFSVLAGPDPRDATSHQKSAPPVDRDAAPSIPASDLRIGIPRDWIDGTDLASAVETGYRQWCRQLQKAGATLVDVDLEHIDVATPVYQVIATAEASSNLARYDGARYGRRASADSLDEMYRQSRTEGFGREVKRRILLGTYVLSEGYIDEYFDRACRVRRLIIEDFDRAFETVDVVATPTTPSTAFERDSKTGPLDAYEEDVFTLPASLAGLPAISIPAGRDEAGLPFGLQLMAPSFEEPTLFSAARTAVTVCDKTNCQK